MYKNVVMTTALFVLMVILLPATSNAQNLSAALQRMDAIIAEMEKLRAEFAALSSSVQASAPTPAVQGVSSSKVLTQDLSYGATNDDIARIQRLLATDPTIYPYGVDSGFFGPKTQEAIRQFQTRFGLDPVGVIGPATTALLEVFFTSYPTENYPNNVLANKPQVLGVQTSAPATSPTPTAPSTVSSAQEINVTFDDGEALIEIIYTNGNRKGLIADTDEEDEVIAYIASKTVLTEAQVSAVIDFSGRSSSSRGSAGDAEEAEDALDAAEEAIDDADAEIEEADEDGEDVDWAEDTLDEADDLLKEAEDAYDDGDYDEAIELAEEAEDMAKKAEDRIGEEKGSEQGDSDEIDSIEADVYEGETDITVEYDNGDDYEFTVEEDDVEDIIAEVADELDIDEDDVEDLIEFDFGDIDRIEVIIDEDDGSSLARVFYESGVERRVRMNETNKDDILDEIADEIDVDVEDIEGITEFDY